MAQPRNKSHARPVFGVLAGLTGAVLLVAFIAPFYGALDRPVTVIEGGAAQNESSQNSGNGIVVEQFDYTEPKPEPEADSGTTGQGAALSSSEDALEREPPRPPLSDSGLASAPEPATPAAPVDEGEPMQLLQRPIAIAAGKLESQGRIVELQGIDTMPPEEKCQSASGESWPCGMQARTAFRQWLRSRAIMCRLPQNDSGGAVATQCNVGADDAALWLVTNGWAKAAPGGPYEEAGQKAEAARLGIYGDKPDTDLPELEPEPEPIPDAAPSDGDFPPAPSPAQ
ncbi:thermonuclease family protein [Falsochrobactrum sp. TDYN1]|uniref:Thermonuclease family protein n=1 Tax=Falsochrobactrum tianjinense TaxID=2706015 RepID=A0A949PMY9_9HYPH|nr:thermonuclease family protein [Falsochrobactrum sp. TDYN1]MBV2143703.1 thermonuclease family protein [Falsochrobactrum sp. TDYN1]